MTDTDRAIAESADRMAALANQALALMASGIANAQQASALLAADVLEIAALLPADQQEAAAGAVARARKIIGPAQGERH